MLVKEFKERREGGFSNAFYELLPDMCPEQGCGYPMEMSEVLTKLHCSNPRCPAKVAQRILALLNRLGVVGLGDSGAEKTVQQWDLKSPLEIFEYNPEMCGELYTGFGYDKSVAFYNALQAKRKHTLAEFVRLANLPGVQTSANDIFGGYDDLEAAYAAIEAGGLGYIKEMLNTDSDIRALKVYESLMLYKDDLFQGVNLVEIIPVNGGGDMKYYKACVSGEVGCGYGTKAEFYEAVNSLPGLHVDFLGSVTRDIDFLIWHGDKVTSKVTKVRNMQAKGQNIRILRADEFMDFLKEG